MLNKMHWWWVASSCLLMAACAPMSQQQQTSLGAVQNNLPLPTLPHATNTAVATSELQWIAEKVYINETGGNPEKLVSWNAQEEFASLGIGHFIWYPVGRTGPFTETFPALLSYMQTQGVKMPTWLYTCAAAGAPWPNKAAFEQAAMDPEVKELRRFLDQTRTLQANFMAMRLQQTLPSLLAQLPAPLQPQLLARYQAVERSPGGLYALLDYVNFKGEGTNPRERYQGQGWGLLQVLLAMTPVEPGPMALQEFARAAEQVLTQRVANSPVERHEANWLAGWRKRIASYQPNLLAANY